MNKRFTLQCVVSFRLNNAHVNEGALATVRARCKLWVYLGTCSAH